jgi:predicted PurR-regulated permease PerM
VAAVAARIKPACAMARSDVVDLLSVFGGFIAFAFLGLFIRPTLIAITFTLVQAWRAAVSGHAAVEVVKPAA